VTESKRICDLLRRALDPAAPEPEALASATALIRQARRDGIAGIGDFVAAVGQALLPPAADYVMPFGKYRGTTLGRIAAINPGYLEWLAEKFEGKAVGRAAAEVLESLELV